MNEEDRAPLQIQWLHEDPGAGWSRNWLWFGRWTFRTTKRRTVCRLDSATYHRAKRHQLEEPFLIGRHRGRQWWWYRDRFYGDAGTLLASEVRAILGETPP